MTTTTYRTRLTRRGFIRRHPLLTALTLPPAAAASAALTAAIWAGATTAAHPAPAPRPGTIAFDTTDIDTTNASTRSPLPAAYSPAAFDIIHSAMRKCKTEDGSGSTLPCASNAQAGIKYIVFSAGRKPRNKPKPVIALYRDGHAERYTI